VIHLQHAEKSLRLFGSITLCGDGSCCLSWDRFVQVPHHREDLDAFDQVKCHRERDFATTDSGRAVEVIGRLPADARLEPSLMRSFR
jgi:hypothetical protein